MHLSLDGCRRPRADDDASAEDDLRDRGLVPFAMWLFERQHAWRFGGGGGATQPARDRRYGLADAQANPPADRLAQLVPAQQSVAIRSHGSPAAAHSTLPSGGAVASSATQAAAPAGPPQVPLQQSSPVLQAAPSGAQLP